MKPTLAVLTVAFLLTSTTTCSKSLTGLEPLPETLVTVQAAADILTTGTVHVPADCNGSVPINCPGGVAAKPAPIDLTRDSIQIVPGGAPRQWYITAWVVAATPKDIPVTVPAAGECGMAINTALDSFPNIEVSFTTDFVTDASDTALNRLLITNASITYFETGDAAITGGILCQAANFGLSLFVNTLTSTFFHNASFCGAPGAALLEPCPPPTVAARAIGMRRRTGAENVDGGPRFREFLKIQGSRNRSLQRWTEFLSASLYGVTRKPGHSGPLLHRHREHE